MEGSGEEAVRKGPWKVEEDEVLLNHVRRYGPRDWSSIRSKGLLRRTGKSCRLRWVNKLRPNLKNGCKFSAEEERVVIELQAQLGNKWAKIATYLPGRTDNDVKNFWSSRQKRLARLLQSSAATSSKSHNLRKEVSPFHEVLKKGVSSFHEVSTFEGPKFSTSSEGESSSKALPIFAMAKMVPLPDLVRPQNNNFLSSQAQFIQSEFNHVEKKPSLDCQSHFAFSPIPQPSQDLPLPSESQDVMARLADSYFSDVLGFVDSSCELGNEVQLPITPPVELGNEVQLPITSPVFAPAGSCHGNPQSKIDNSVTPDWFFDDFPANIFDQMEPLPSPSDL